MPGARRPTRVAVAGIVLACLGVAGCSDSGSDAAPLPGASEPSGSAPSSDTSAAPSPGRETLTSGDVTLVMPARVDAATERLLRDYLAFWVAYAEAAAIPDAQYAKLRARSDSSAFAAFSRGIESALVRQHRTLRGPLMLTPTVRTSLGQVRTIDDCVDASQQRYHDRSGAKTDEAGEQNSFTITLRPANVGFVVTGIAEARTPQCGGS
jgi:hypothetical protein